MVGYVLIETGGTFSMGRNKEGKLTPTYDIRFYCLAMAIADLSVSNDIKKELLKTLTEANTPINNHGIESEEVTLFLNKLIDSINKHRREKEPYNLDSLFALYKFNQEVKKPYTIDSIVFDIHEHYPLLFKSIMDSLSTGEHVIVIGGTDTLEFYAKMIAYDPRYQKWRNENIDNTSHLIFLSSMVAFCDGPAHIAALLAHAQTTTEEPTPTPFTYAITAKDSKCTAITQHDLYAPLAKISATKFNAFRSGSTAETPESMAKNMTSLDGRTFNKVAPPLINGNSCAVIESYLRHFHDAVVIIELPLHPSESNDRSKWNAILELVKERSANGIHTIVVNDLRFNIMHRQLMSTTPNDHVICDRFVLAFQKEGGIVVQNTTTNDTYAMALFTSVPPIKAQSSQERHPLVGPQPQIGIQYVPDQEMFKDALDACKTLAGHGEQTTVVLRALPGNTLPISMQGCLLETLDAPSVATICVGCKYPEGKPQSKYAAAGEAGQHVQQLRMTSPSRRLSSSSVSSMSSPSSSSPPSSGGSGSPGLP